MKRQILLSLILLSSVLTMNAQDVFMKYQRGYQTGALGSFKINGAFDANIPDNPGLWSDYPAGIGYATLNNFRGDKLFTQLLSNADNSNFWIRTSNYTDGTPSAIGNNWNKIWHSGNFNATDAFTKYSRNYQTGSLGDFRKSGTFDINTPDNPSQWSDYPIGIGYATLNVFLGDKMVTQLLSNADNSNFWIRTSNYTDGTPSATGNGWNKIWHSGNINRNDIDFKCQNLFANGNLWAKEIKVALTNPWADFVFKSDYKLKRLADLELFIKENGHLPEIPNASDVEKNGVNIGEMQSKLLQKMEEMTLYVIEQNKKIEAIQEQNELLKQEIELLKKK